MNDVIEYWDSSIVANHVRISEVVEYFNSIGKSNINYIDIGANVGKVYDMLNEGIGVNKCILVEPNRDLFQYMTQKYKHVNGITLIEKGITIDNGLFEFVNISSSHIAQGKTELLNLGLNKISGKTEAYGDNYLIEGITGDNFMRNINNILPQELDYIKMDTENCDFFILESILPYLIENKIRPYISFESNYLDFLSIEKSQEIIDRYTHELNYRHIDLESATKITSDLNLIPLP